MENNFKSGEVVQLKTGGPKMIIKEIDLEMKMAYVSWLDTKEQVQSKDIELSLLKYAPNTTFNTIRG
ncbi:DUF2158 domain-containing protein [Flavobacterium sp. HSC-61S13]|uniref:DUF2158 domain-containing protein n=1 Tax=Flavobacterium sp. HSC-61S13 TaxID=2910963 RepID=UPI00209F6624|nr:DUF2158 domain-containing protein [Flavobacterium sp. HSC-61S13]MCP1995644.1 uncharacterized protein YodC (DUF2158 family) [Flavobacterium sp. HSC-61S13]